MLVMERRIQTGREAQQMLPVLGKQSKDLPVGNRRMSLGRFVAKK